MSYEMCPNRKTKFLNDVYTPMFIAVLNTIISIWKQLNCPAQLLYIHNGIQCTYMKKILWFAASERELVDIMLSEIRQRNDKKQMMSVIFSKQ